MTVGQLRHLLAGLPPDKEVKMLSRVPISDSAYIVRLIGIRAADSLQENGDLWLLPGAFKEYLNENT